MEANSQVNTAIIDDLRGIETLKSLRVKERRYQEIDSGWLKNRGSVSFQCLYLMVWGTIGYVRATICWSVDYL